MVEKLNALMSMAMHIVNILFQVYTIMLFARIMASWVPEFQQYRLYQFIAYYTDPYLNIFRKVIPPLGMIDISPIVAFFVLSIAKNIIIKFLS